MRDEEVMILVMKDLEREVISLREKEKEESRAAIEDGIDRVTKEKKLVETESKNYVKKEFVPPEIYQKMIEYTDLVLLNSLELVVGLVIRERNIN